MAMKWNFDFGFIGMGNMGFAMMKGLLGKFTPRQLTFCERSQEKAEDVSAATAVLASDGIASCVESSRFVVLAVKPQQLDVVLSEVKKVLQPEQAVISIAPGREIRWLSERLNGHARIVRAMPNTPALAGEGMSGVCYQDELFTGPERELIASFFTSFGKMERVPEELINAVVCASGSSPAYVYMFIEALADSAVKYGLPRATAYRMAAQTVLGSAKMVLETGRHPGELKDAVCSPAGTTIAAVSALEESGFRSAVIKAADACYKKCTGM